MEIMCNTIVKTINKFIEIGYTIVILSCASLSHIMTYIDKYVSNIKSILDKVTIIGSDNEFYMFKIIDYYTSGSRWKYKKMTNFVNKFTKNQNITKYDIISIGDSENERLAVIELCTELKTVVKSLKLFNKKNIEQFPTIELIYKQWNLILNNINTIINSGSFDIMIIKK